MKRNTVRSLIPLLFLAAWAAQASGAPGDVPPELTQVVRPSNPLLHFNGRFVWRDPEAPGASFPGSEVVVRFIGAELAAKMSTTGEDEVQVVIDGRPDSVLRLSKEPVLYWVGRGLGPGEHTAVLFKRTEAHYGWMTILGLYLPAGSELLPVPRVSRNIEFIGDSITCGFGNEAASKDERNSASNSNHYLSYASIAARRLGAEHVSVCASGIRLTEARGLESMPAVYRRTGPREDDPPWDFGRGPIPDVVVIDLGTNDFHFVDDLGAEEWERSYNLFLDFIRARRPDAQIFLANGPMMPLDSKLEHLRRWNRDVAERRQAAGDTKLHLLDFNVQDPADGFGSGWHPSVRTHEKMAVQLVSAIESATGW